MASWYVYIVRCGDGSLYTGVTTDRARRLRQHNGKLPGGSSYCRSRRPIKLLWSKKKASRAAALKREYAIKQMTKPAKEKLLRRGK